MSGINPKKPTTPSATPMNGNTSTDYSKGLSVGKAQTIKKPGTQPINCGVPSPTKVK